MSTDYLDKLCNTNNTAVEVLLSRSISLKTFVNRTGNYTAYVITVYTNKIFLLLRVEEPNTRFYAILKYIFL